jgi:DNA-binding GntR family transcriptional regulator
MDKLFKINDYELLSKKVYRILRTRIINGNFKPGEKILEVNIAEQLGVSRTPVREALRELAAEGFVKMEPNLGMIVTDFSLEDLKEDLQIRRVLEGFAASVAAKKINQEEIAQLEEIMKKMSLIVSKSKPDVVAYSELNALFHNLVLKVCGNKRLVKICVSLNNSEHRFRIRSLRNNPQRLKYSLKEHQEILEALKRKDAEQAERLSKEHIKNVLENILTHEGKEEDI